MSSANSFRRFCATPLLMFDQVRLSMQKHPKPSNGIMMMSSFVVLLCLGNGAEKLSTQNSVGRQYEKLRRANRLYMPYFLADYSYRFPQIKQ